MIRRFALLAAATLLAGAALAQDQPAGAPDQPAGAQEQPAGDQPASKAASPKLAEKKKSASKSDKSDPAASGAASIIGKTLKLNGASGVMMLSKSDKEAKDKSLKIDKLTLSGEVISNPTQKCEITIAADGAMAAANQGAPDGLPRYGADIPACPLSFDVVQGGVIVPPQTRACVFQAADCQASPSGFWGPDAASLAPDAKAIAKSRSRAESSICESLKTLSKRAKGAAAELDKEQSDFNTAREEICRDYDGEATHGFCDARVTEARAALLRKQAAKAKRDASNE